MKFLPVLVIAFGAALAQARPVVIEESARITNPDPTNFPYFASDVAVDGDDAIITMERYFDPPLGGDASDQEHDVAVHLFHRSGNTWTPVKQLVLDHDFALTTFKAGLAMRNGIAALALNPLYVFERQSNGDWVSASVTGVDLNNPGDSVTIDGNRILFGGSSGPWMGTLYERNSTGVWGPTSTMVGDFRGGDIEFSGGPVDISGNRAIVLSPYNDAEPMLASPSVAAFSEWGPPRRFLFQSEIRSSEAAPLGYAAAIRGDEIFIAGTNTSGTRVYRPGPSDSWEEFDKLRPLDSYMGGGVATLIQKNYLFILQRNWNAERNAYVVNVFRKIESEPYEHVATLAASRGGSLGNFAISSRRVIADCGGEACIFELPASFSQPALVQQTFAGLTASDWSTSAGSAFTIVRRGISRVLRQSDATSPATHVALLNDSDWTNQSIQVDIRPLSFAAGGWDGVATRYRNAANNYYVRVDGTGLVTLRRKVSGVIKTLASAQARVILNRPYRLRLESIGTRHRVYFNGAPLLDVDDAKLTSGRAALLTHTSSAEFDNVVVSPTPATILYARDFSNSGGPNDLWTFTGIGLWQNTTIGTEQVFTQSSVAGVARAVAGVPTDDQSIDVLARATTFAGTGDGDRWFGVMARYVDDANYYYLTVRSTNSVSLRKLTNGTITVLTTYSLPVTLGTWYRLRIEAVGSQIRGYVNGTLVGEATDSTHASGAGGPITNRAAVDFDDYRAIQP